ncbi:MAG: site-specific integrase [Candidatus Korobacteraceae bacterium]
MRRTRYQYGSLELVKGAKQSVWTFRFYQPGTDGKRQYRRIRVGTTQEYPTRTAALRRLEGLRLSVNSGNFQAATPTFRAIVERYVREEMPERFSTQSSYKSLFNRWLQPKWNDVPVTDFRSLEVEHWLKSLPLANKTRANLRNLMHSLFECARRWELTTVNPIELVRQSSRRQRIPRRLTVEELRLLLEQLQPPYSVMVILAACLGLRVGEILGLQWGDVDLLNATLTVRRTVYQYHVGPAKTAYSEAALPLALEIVAALRNWLACASYRAEGDFVFPSAKGGPRDADKLRENVLQPAANRAGLGKIGWHSLRHSFATALDVAGARMKVAQELMRHASITTTMDTYTGTVEREKRETAGRVATAVLGNIQ